MNILLVHNEYGKVSGEEVVVRALRNILEANGHQVVPYFRSSTEINGSASGNVKAFCTGIYNFGTRRVFREMLRDLRPDIVHIHNLYPLISPSILGQCRRAGVPVVMTVHNYRLVCPNGLHLVRGKICERCVGGNEFQCVLNRCEGSLLKSAGYALRNAVARKLQLFHRHVTMYAALTEFQRRRLMDAGIPADRIAVVPNMVQGSAINAHPADGQTSEQDITPGDWIGYVGRISHEKGMLTLLKAAASMPEVPFKIAGALDRMPDLPAQATPNVEFVGHLDAKQLEAFYRRSRMIVMCSTWFEGFPMVLAEAMLRSRPIICSRIGGLPEIVDDGVTGLLFSPGNAVELAQRIRHLWDNPSLCMEMGQAGRFKAARNYSTQTYYDRLLGVYSKARELGAGGVNDRKATGAAARAALNIRTIDSP